MIDLSKLKKVRDAKHWYREISQLYHPTGEIEQDSQNLVYSCGVLNVTKFVPILLKEWFFLAEKEGYLVIDYCPNKICDWQKLEEEMWQLWKNKYEIIYHGPVEKKETDDLDEKKLLNFIREKEKYQSDYLDSESLLPKVVPTETFSKEQGGYVRFICKKSTETKIEGDKIEKWTFGIVTNGNRKDWLEDIFASIRKQNIPQYEILVCGTYYDRKEPDIRYIPFNQRDDKGWITRKKNTISKKAKYENICIIHDRMYFGEGWFGGMKKWGNCFEVLAVPQLYFEDKKRFGDWVCVKDFDFKTANNYIPINSGYMDYRDWDKDIPSYAGVTIVKRKILQENPYNETRYWGVDQYEDILLHQSIRSKGNVLRMNPDSITYSKSRSVIDYGWHYEFNKKRIGKLRGVSIWIRTAFWIFHLVGFDKTSSTIGKIRTIIKNRRSIKTNQDFGGKKLKG